jgi:hypothetical protein
MAKQPELPIVGYAQLAAAMHATPKAGLESAGVIKTSAEVSKAEVLVQISEAMSALEQAQPRDGVFVAPDDRITALVQSYLARRAGQEQKVVQTPSGLEAKFDSGDVFGWAGSLADHIKGSFNRHDFIDRGGQPQQIDNKFRIALLSDWGTGLYGAPVCAESIEKDQKVFDLLLHLGDVYYSGDKDEVEERFLKFWPDVPGAMNRALNANHEMYSGGRGYFDLILKKFNQDASYFALQNKHWILVGLDTAYSEHELHGSQVEWLLKLVENEDDNRRLVLFSHHQPYSLFEKQGSKLVSQLGKLLDTRRIHAWYWGHEHRCVVYDPHPQWGLLGRCVGHSGFPYFRDKFAQSLSHPGWQHVPGKNLVPGAKVLDGPNKYVDGRSHKYGPNGYVVLEFDDRDMRELYLNPDGTPLPSPV